MRILFAGTPDFAVPTLTALIESADCEVVGCYTQPDRPAGRGRAPRPSPVKLAAVDAGVPVLQPVSLKGSQEQDQLREFSADLMVVVAYGLLLPKAVLHAPAYGCVNVHASLLPRWRGAAPIQRAILAGDTESGVCVMQMAAGLDTGDVWSSWSCPIDQHTTGASLHDQLMVAGAALLIDTLPDVFSQARSPTPQDDAASCYARKLDKSESAIDWNQSADQICRQIRAFNPWPVAQCGSERGIVRVWQAHVLEGRASAELPGEVTKESGDGIHVQTGDGVLVVTRLQLAGKRQVSAAEFVNGHSLLGQTLT